MIPDKHRLIDELLDFFKAFSDHTRIAIIWLLTSNMIDKISVNEISEIIKLSQPAISQHLKILKNVGLLKRKKDGNTVYYYVDLKSLEMYKEKIDTLFIKLFQKCKDPQWKEHHRVINNKEYGEKNNTK